MSAAPRHLFLLIGLVGCGALDDLLEDPIASTDRIALSLESSSLTIPPGGEQSVALMVRRHGDHIGVVILLQPSLRSSIATVGGDPHFRTRRSGGLSPPAHPHAGGIP